MGTEPPPHDAVLDALPVAVVVVDGSGTILLANACAERTAGGPLAGRDFAELIPARAIADEVPLAGGQRLLVLRTRGDVLRQQAAVADLGRRALAGEPLASLMEQTARSIAEVLGVDMVEVLELLPGGTEFVSRGQVGWGEQELVPVADTHVGLSLIERGPVLLEDSETETRFAAEPLRAEHDVISGFAVPMLAGARELGAIGVHSRTRRKFTEDEIYFVQGAAALLATGLQRRRAEEELEQSWRLLRAVLDASPAVIFVKDLDGHVTLGNRRFEEMFAERPGETIGQHNSALVGPDIAAAFNAHDRAVVAAGAPIEFEERVALDGNERIFVSLKFPVRDPSGRITAVGCVATDVTERTLAAEERAQLQARLGRAERLETVGQLAGGIAHDFNNLLAVIANYAEFLRDAVPTGSRAADDVEQILAASRAANELTRRLLLFSRRRAGNPEVVDLTTVIGETQGLLERVLGEPVALRTHIQPGLWSVHADRAQLEQVLMNLAINSRDAMPEGGTLAIEACNVALEDDGRGLAGDCVRLTVTDTGVGMPEAVLDRAFEPFFSTKAAGEGRGLGLATVYGIVRGAGGQIELRSRPERGTEVTVHLPATRAPAPAGTADEAGERPVGGGERLLLVEDKEAVRILTSRILEDAGYAVTTAPDGMEAIELFETGGTIDALVTDVIMPGLSGQELADNLRARRPGLPVVFVSGYTEDHVVEDARREGATEFVEKPFRADDLLRAVRSVLEA